MTPQIIVIVLLFLEMFLACIFHGYERKNVSATRKLIDISVIIALLWWGGFWEVLK